MRVRDSKRLIVDADVAGACGSKTPPGPTAKHCRDFLNTILSLSYRVVMTEKIRDEWRRHASPFARRWRVSMDARRKVDRIVDLPENEELCTKIVNTAGSERQRENIEKDFHLLQAALATDQTIISLDETIFRLFKRASQQVGEIRNVIWVNPDKTAEEPIAWLQNGAQPEAHRRLVEKGS